MVTRKSGTEVKPHNLAIPLALFDQLESRRGATNRTAFINAALEWYLDAANADNLSRHLVDLPLAESLEAEAYRRVTGATVTNIAPNAITTYVHSKLDGNPNLQREFNEELLKLRNEMKPPISIVNDRSL